MASRAARAPKVKPMRFLRSKLRRHSYLVCLFLKSLASGLFVTQSQYVYRRVAAEYTDDLDAIKNATSSKTCGVNEVNMSSPEYQIYAKISAESARWAMYQTLCNGIPPIITILLLGAYSDQVGRRFLFLLPMASLTIRGAIASITMYFDLHLGFLLVGEVIEGITGGGFTLMIGTFSYTADQHNTELMEKKQYSKAKRSGRKGVTDGAEESEGSRNGEATGISYTKSSANGGGRMEDEESSTVVSSKNSTTEALASVIGFSDDITDDDNNFENDDIKETAERIREGKEIPDYDKNRAVRLLAIECFNVMCLGIVQLVNGYFIAFAGFFYSLLTATIIMVINFIYTFVVIKNPPTQIRSRSAKKSVLEPLRIVFRAIRQPRKLSAFLLCNLAIIFLVFGDGGILRTLPIYQMSPPFCWTSVQIGWFNSEFFFTTIFSVPFLMFLKRFDLSEPTMAGIGETINALGTAVYALANVYSWVFFVVAAITPPGMLAYALTRTISSRLAGPEAHGSMFAFTSLVEHTMSLVGALVGSGIYQVTVSKFHAAIFIYFAGLYGLSAMTYFVEAILERCRPPLPTDAEADAIGTTVPGPDKVKAETTSP